MTLDKSALLAFLEAQWDAPVAQIIAEIEAGTFDVDQHRPTVLAERVEVEA